MQFKGVCKVVIVGEFLCVPSENSFLSKRRVNLIRQIVPIQFLASPRLSKMNEDFFVMGKIRKDHKKYVFPCQC